MQYKRTISFLIGLFIVLPGTMRLAAQKTSFIYIQTESKVPFTVQIGDKYFQSNTTGYLMMPSLYPKVYTLVISFPKGQYANQTFLCDVREKNRGFWLRQGLDNQMVLLDQVSREEIKNEVGKDLSMINYENKVNKMLIDTISVNRQGERIKQSNPFLGNGTSVIYKPEVKPSRMPTSVTRFYEKVGVNGINQSYVVLNGSKVDTVHIFIPALEETKDFPMPASRKSNKPKESDSADPDQEAPVFDLPMPGNATIPKKAKAGYN